MSSILIKGVFKMIHILKGTTWMYIQNIPISLPINEFFGGK